MEWDRAKYCSLDSAYITRKYHAIVRARYQEYVPKKYICTCTDAYAKYDQTMQNIRLRRTKTKQTPKVTQCVSECIRTTYNARVYIYKWFYVIIVIVIVRIRNITHTHTQRLRMLDCWVERAIVWKSACVHFLLLLQNLCVLQQNYMWKIRYTCVWISCMCHVMCKKDERPTHETTTIGVVDTRNHAPERLAHSARTIVVAQLVLSTQHRYSHYDARI